MNVGHLLEMTNFLSVIEIASYRVDQCYQLPIISMERKRGTDFR